MEPSARDVWLEDLRQRDPLRWPRGPTGAGRRVAIELMAAANTRSPQRRAHDPDGRMLACLSYPDIARLIVAGVTAQGQPCLVLAYMQGEDIG
jgi:eukaryotic-like serine/threonine-protein kinase